MTTVNSRAMARLDAAITAARSVNEAACLRAERAALLGRQGHFDEARAELTDVRASVGDAPSAAATIWLCLAEGMIDQYSHFGAAARDRIRRAHALSTAARLRPLIALSAAWLAHLDYLYSDLPAMARHVAEALQEADDNNHAARARASLVVAAAYHWAGRLDLAQPWYRRARDHATADGDEAAVSALLVNRAWIDGNRARLDALFGDAAAVPDAAQLRRLLLGVESAGAFDQHVGKTSMRSYALMQRAQLVLLQGDAAAALALYERHLPTAIEEGMAYMKPVFLADIAWCKHVLGRNEDAIADARDAEASFTTDCEEEDRAAAHGRLALLYAALGLNDEASRHREQAQADLQAVRAMQARIVELMDQALAQVPGLR